MAYLIKFQLLLLPSPFSGSNKIFPSSRITLAWHCITILSFFWENRLTHQDGILQLTYILLISKMTKWVVKNPRRINLYEYVRIIIPVKIYECIWFYRNIQYEYVCIFLDFYSYYFRSHPRKSIAADVQRNRFHKFRCDCYKPKYSRNHYDIGNSKIVVLHKIEKWNTIAIIKFLLSFSGLFLDHILLYTRIFHFQYLHQYSILFLHHMKSKQYRYKLW